MERPGLESHAIWKIRSIPYTTSNRRIAGVLTNPRADFTPRHVKIRALAADGDRDARAAVAVTVFTSNLSKQTCKSQATTECGREFTTRHRHPALRCRTYSQAPAGPICARYQWKIRVRRKEIAHLFRIFKRKSKKVGYRGCDLPSGPLTERFVSIAVQHFLSQKPKVAAVRCGTHLQPPLFL